MDVVDVALGDLRPHPRNPRKITPARLEQLGRTLEAERDMLRARPVIALPDGTVVAGNQRLAAAKALGWESIPTVYADLDERQQTRWMLLDNRGFGEDVVEDVAVLLAELQTAGDDPALTGYDPADVDRLLASIAQPTGDPEAAPEPPAEPRSVRGEVYELGPHRVMCGDSSLVDDIASLLRGETVTLVLADPPYNVNYRGGTNIGNGQVKRERDDAYDDKFDDYAGWLAAVLSNAHASSDHRACLLLWHSTSQLRAIYAALDAARWVDRSFIVWDKGSIQGGIGQTSKQYRTQFEPMLHCHKKGKTPRWFGPGNEADIWAVTGPRRNPLHPTMKPVELYERSLRNHSQHGDQVLECFGGSGTSLIACEILGRRAHLMEIDPAYCDVIRQRYADYTGQPDLAP